MMKILKKVLVVLVCIFIFLVAIISCSSEDATKSVDASSSANIVQETKVEMTVAQEQAYRSAQNYINVMPFSRQGLIDQLSSEYGDNYEVADAEFAVNLLESNGKVDWNEQAYKAAEDYLSLMGFSLEGLIHQLESEAGSQFTHEQAVYGAEKAYNK